MEKIGGKFLRPVVFVMGVIYLLFILGTIIFSGKVHPIWSSVTLEYIIAISAVLFCLGIGLVLIGMNRRLIFSIVAIAGSLVFALVGFSLFWKSPAGIVAVGVVVVLLGVQVLVCKVLISGSRRL